MGKQWEYQNLYISYENVAPINISIYNAWAVLFMLNYPNEWNLLLIKLKCFIVPKTKYRITSNLVRLRKWLFARFFRTKLEFRGFRDFKIQSIYIPHSKSWWKSTYINVLEFSRAVFCRLHYWVKCKWQFKKLLCKSALN